MRKIIQVYKEFTSFEGSLFQYSLSFSLLLALAPSILLFSMLFRFAYLPIDLILHFIQSFLPDLDPEVLDQIFLYFVDKDYSLIGFIVTGSISFYLASRSIYSFLLISATHEQVYVPKWSIRMKAVVMFMFLTVVFLVGAYWISQFPSWFPFIVSGMMLFLFVAFYRILSFRKRKWYFGWLGAVFTTISILLLCSAFITIVDTFTSYQDVYGPIAILVTSLLAIYLISCIIYLGFCINIVFTNEYQKEELLVMKHPLFFTTCMKIQAWMCSKFS